MLRALAQNKIDFLILGARERVKLTEKHRGRAYRNIYLTGVCGLITGWRAAWISIFCGAPRGPHCACHAACAHSPAGAVLINDGREAEFTENRARGTFVSTTGVVGKCKYLHSTLVVVCVFFLYGKLCRFNF